MRSGKKGQHLAEIETVCELSPEQFQQRTPFKRLVAIDPVDRFNLAAGGETSMRLVDLIAPIGKGTRGLIVAPPKAGKTILLEQIARAMQADEPDTRLVVLLIDERPEEVTHFRRTIAGAEVFASSSDQPVKEHVELSELMLAHIRTELECGRNVVVLLDSLTRLVRAFNLRGSQAGRSRTMSGGVEASALQIPRRLFGLARNIEHGGSVTIVASVLVDTGSRMDQFIFEEFKGTGNSEIVLDRAWPRLTSSRPLTCPPAAPVKRSAFTVPTTAGGWPCCAGSCPAVPPERPWSICSICWASIQRMRPCCKAFSRVESNQRLFHTEYLRGNFC